MTAPEPPSYIDYESFLDPSFSAVSFANSLVLATNNPSDSPLDLTTPLSRVLFDVQEIDTHIHNLTTTSALPLLTHTREDRDASQRIVKEVEAQVAGLTQGYERLEKEVLLRWEATEEVRLATERLWQTVKIGRSVGRCLLLGRQLEVQIIEAGGLGGGGSPKKEDHRAMVRASNTLLSLRQIFSSSGEGEEGEGLDKVNVVTTLKSDLVNPSERNIRNKAQQIIREFSLSNLSATSGATATSTNLSSLQQQQPSITASPSTYVQTEDTKSRATSAFLTLYLLSSIPTGAGSNGSSEPDMFQPDLLVAALQAYLQTSLTSSLAALARALSSLPTLDRALLEVSARCQNIVALEALLESTKPPPHPFLSSGGPNQRTPPPNLLAPLLQSLDTTSLPSHFWRSLASSLAPRVMDILNKGGVAARTLRTNRDRVRDGIRECVIKGSQVPGGTARGAAAKKNSTVGGWEREVGVMVGAVVGTIGR